MFAKGFKLTMSCQVLIPKQFILLKVCTLGYVLKQKKLGVLFHSTLTAHANLSYRGLEVLMPVGSSHG